MHYLISDNMFRDFFRARALYFERPENVNEKDRKIRLYKNKFLRRNEREKNFLLGFLSDDKVIFPELLKATIDDYSSSPISIGSVDDWENFLDSLNDSHNPAKKRILELLDGKTRRIITSWNHKKNLPDESKEAIITGFNNLLMNNRFCYDEKFKGIFDKIKKPNNDAKNKSSKDEKDEFVILNKKIVEKLYASEITNGYSPEDIQGRFNNKFNEMFKYLNLTENCITCLKTKCYSESDYGNLLQKMKDENSDFYKILKDHPDEVYNKIKNIDHNEVINEDVKILLIDKINRIILNWDFSFHKNPKYIRKKIVI